MIFDYLSAVVRAAQNVRAAESMLSIEFDKECGSLHSTAINAGDHGFWCVLYACMTDHEEKLNEHPYRKGTDIKLTFNSYV